MRIPLFATLLAGCGAAAQPLAPAARPTTPASFAHVEDEVLRDLAAVDARLARRSRVTPSTQDLRRVAMAAVLEEDRTVVLVDGAIDPLSFDARARGLSAAKGKIARLPAESTERELLDRLVEGEVVRLEEERALPRSSSALVRAIVETWQAPESDAETAEDDRWLARRLSEIRESLAEGLDVVRARELDDALDALEHLATGLTRATQELVRLREALEETAARAGKAPADWDAVTRRARAHLGLAPDEARLERTEKAARALAERALAETRLGRDVSGSLEKQAFAAGPCLDAVPASRVRSMAAPNEREPGCHLRHLVARAAEPADRATALALLHDHVVLAQWALAVARGGSLAEAERKHRLLVAVPPEARSHLERIALARPVAALGAAETARLLLDGDPRARATAWSALGDVPLDVAERELPR